MVTTRDWLPNDRPHAELTTLDSTKWFGEVTREVLRGARSGFFAVGDSLGLARQKRKWGRDPGERRRAGQVGRAVAEGTSWALIFDDLVREYREVLRRHRSARASAT